MKTIVLTGGTSRRFGRDKMQVAMLGKTVLEYAVSGIDNPIIVGPETPIHAEYVREIPIGSGPLAGIYAGLQSVDTHLVAILAGDMPFAHRIIPQILPHLIHDAVFPVDAFGTPQPLAGVYRAEKLREVLESFNTTANKSIRSMVAMLEVDIVEIDEPRLLMDIDTPEDLISAITLARGLADDLF